LEGDLDGAALFGLVDRIGELGLELLEVRRFPGRTIVSLSPQVSSGTTS
jgi:hypothetical protein